MNLSETNEPINNDGEPANEKALIMQPELDAPTRTEESNQATLDSQAAHTEAMNNPDVSGQTPATDEIPAHKAAQMHAPYAEKPLVQVQNEALTNGTPTGYIAHDIHTDLDEAQLESQEPSDTDAYREAKQRVEGDEPTEENTAPEDK